MMLRDKQLVKLSGVTLRSTQLNGARAASVCLAINPAADLPELAGCDLEHHEFIGIARDSSNSVCYWNAAMTMFVAHCGIVCCVA